MDALKFKRTKIIATVGPATESVEKIHALLAAGVNGVRLNLSHGTLGEHAERIARVRAAAKKLQRSVAVIADLPGPKLRLGSLPAGGVTIHTGDTVKFQYGANYAETQILPIQHDFADNVQKGHAVFLRDGQIKALVLGVKAGVIRTRALNSGKVMSNHGINLPDTEFSGGVITARDRRFITWATEHDADYIALSFVQSAADITQLKDILKEHKSDIRVIAKIETKVATQHLRDIITAADVVMVARGDLAVETYPEDVPVLQRQILNYGRAARTPVIVATQMLESMMNSLTPNRAEVSDIASAVGAGADAVMLSGETSVGNYPIETVAMMKRVILKMEAYMAEVERRFDVPPDTDRQVGVSVAAVTLARQLKAKIILTETLTGTTARNVAALRPYQSIVMASPNLRVCNQLAIVWGSKPFLTKRRFEAEDRVIQELKRRGNVGPGDIVVAAFGQKRGVAGGTDTVRLVEVR